jgi:hypothetical protein
MAEHCCTKEFEISRILLLTEQQGEHLERLRKLMEGNGQPGLRTEVDRNTQFRKVAMWVAGAAVAQVFASIGVIVTITSKLIAD